MKQFFRVCISAIPAAFTSLNSVSCSSGQQMVPWPLAPTPRRRQHLWPENSTLINLFFPLLMKIPSSGKMQFASRFPASIPQYQLFPNTEIYARTTPVSLFNSSSKIALRLLWRRPCDICVSRWQNQTGKTPGTWCNQKGLHLENQRSCKSGNMGMLCLHCRSEEGSNLQQLKQTV